MLDKIKKLHSEITSLKINTRQELESYRLKYLSKKGIISSLFEEFRNIPNTIKKETGQRLNELKQTAQAKFDSLKSSLNTSEETRRDVDTTKPSYSFVSGSRHPISIVRREIIDIFSRIGLINTAFSERVSN